MQPEALAHGAGETQTPEEQLEFAFKEAQRAFYDLPFAEGFDELCAEEGVDPADTDKPEYWKTVADFALDQSKKAREAGEDEKQVVMRELLAATPDFVYTQAQLDKRRRDFPDHRAYEEFRREIPALKERASYYNGLIRVVAEGNPAIRASGLQRHMLNVINISIEQKQLKFASVNFVREVVRGAQHELAFGQLLERTGRDFRPANIQEDLHGVDYVVDGKYGPMHLDVKASLKSIRAKNVTDDTFAIDPEDGQITIFSYIQDHELRDRFHVSDSVAEERGTELTETLRYIEATSDTVIYAERRQAR